MYGRGVRLLKAITIQMRRESGRESDEEWRDDLYPGTQLRVYMTRMCIEGREGEVVC